MSDDYGNKLCEYLKTLAGDGDVRAWVRLGDLYVDGKIVPQDYAKAIEYYKKGCQLGDEQCCKSFDELSKTNQSISQDSNKTQKTFNKISDSDEGKKYNELGNKHYNGKGVLKNYTKAKAYYEKAADLGNGEACNNLGNIYRDGLGVSRDYSKAKEYYEKAVDLDNGLACNHLGSLYRDGLGVSKDYTKAFECYEKAVDLGNGEACNNLGNIYRDGLGVSKDYTKAFECYERGCKLNDWNCYLGLGILYENGLGVLQDSTKAQEAFDKAIELGGGSACDNLGNLYRDGRGVRQDYIQAVKYYEKGCKLGNQSCCQSLDDLHNTLSDGWVCHKLGYMYATGDEVPRNYIQAVKYYEKGCQLGDQSCCQSLNDLPNKLNDGRACCNLGDMYRDGRGVRQDYIQAVKYYEKGCQLGDKDCCFNLGVLYENGHGVPQDFTKAAKYYERGYQLGYKACYKSLERLCNDGHGVACELLGNLYRDGLGVPQDYSKAIKYYEKGCKLGDQSCCQNLDDLPNKLNDNQACCNLGDMYTKGDEVPQDYNKAIEYYEKGCELGNGKACNHLGNLYRDGLGVSQDYSKAVKYYEIGCQLGDKNCLASLEILSKERHVEACKILGNLYRDGLGVRQDYIQAVKYYEKGCKLGDQSCCQSLDDLPNKLNDGRVCCNLGDMYAKGDEVPQDYSKAVKYYERGCQLGDKNCLTNLETLSKERHVEACKILGNLYRDGLGGISRNYIQAVKYYEKGCQLGDQSCCQSLDDLPNKLNDGRACCNLGDMYIEGNEVPQDYNKAIEYYEKGCELGNGKACNHLGNLYRDGLGVSRNYTKAFECYERGCKLNDWNCYLGLGILYENGHGVPQDSIKAQEAFEKAIELGRWRSYSNLGNMYRDGLGVPQDYNKAIEYYEKGCKLGDKNCLTNLETLSKERHVEACKILGNLYRDGLGVRQDYIQAVKYYEKGCKLGDQSCCQNLNDLPNKLNDGQACCNLGDMYIEGNEVPQDYSKAVKYYERGCQLGDKNCLASLETLSKERHVEACKILGNLYRDGRGVRQDYIQAIKYYEKGCKLGNQSCCQSLDDLPNKLNDGQACCNLGDMYIEGNEVPQDYNKAIEYYERGCQLGDKDCCFNLGVLYENGDKTPQDYNKAIEYYEKGCELGNGKACNHLGNLYHEGKGVLQDYSKAAKYYERGCQLGDWSCLTNLETLSKKGQGVAFNSLGNLYRDGLGGISQNYIQVVKYYERGCQLGDQNCCQSLNDLPNKLNDGRACCNLGDMYAKGNEVPQDYSKAVKYYERGFKLGDKNCLVNLETLSKERHGEACKILGNLYRDGLGVPQDYTKAIKYYEKGCQLGDQSCCQSLDDLPNKLNDGRACYNLGDMYAKGNEVPQDYSKAVKYYERGCQLNDWNCCLGLGVLYEKGLGVPQDSIKAREYYEKGCQLGHGDCFNSLENLCKNGHSVACDFLGKKYYHLGNRYYKGQGVPKDFTRAENLYQKGADLGDEDCLEVLKRFF